MRKPWHTFCALIIIMMKQVYHIVKFYHVIEMHSVYEVLTFKHVGRHLVYSRGVRKTACVTFICAWKTWRKAKN